MSQVTQAKLPCPKCPSSDAYHEFDDGHGYCFSCQYYKHPKGSKDVKYTYEYLPRRGINRSTLEFYDIKTKIDEDGKPISVGYRYPWGDYQVRLLDDKQFYWEPRGSKQGLFGRDKFTGGGQYVIITEGADDAASVRQVLGGTVVSVISASSAARDVSSDRSWVNSHDKIYLGFDSDAPGREAVKNVARLFDYNKVYVLDWGIRKDANEYLQAGETDKIRGVFLGAKRYLPETVVAVNSDNIKELLGAKPKLGVPYPPAFKTLNDMTYGIRKGESVLITAQEGQGKTQLMHAILHQLLKETDDAIGGIFLEEDKPDLLRALAAVELQRPAFLPDAGCSELDIIQAVTKSIGGNDRLHLYNHFGSDDPDVLLDTIRFLVTCRNVGYILLDHIGMCVSGLADEKDERRALDYISTRLAMMIKELGFALILVSHVNDEGKTRGSRLIGKDCHVRIDATRDVLSTNETLKNTLDLVISKNRPPMGKTGKAGSYLFDPFTRQYKEVEHAQSVKQAV